MTPVDPVDRAARALARDRLVVFPTDTLYGLGARADRPSAVRRLLMAKGRPPSIPLSFAVSSYEEIERWASLDPPARAEVRGRLPGPYTLLLRANAHARRSLAPAVVGPGGTIGVRIPDHPIARRLAFRSGPVVATSANRHGRPPARSIEAARRTFETAVEVYLDGPPAPRGRPSQIIDLTGGAPRAVPRG